MANVFEEVISEISPNKGKGNADIFSSVIDEIKPVNIGGEEYTARDAENPNLSALKRTAELLARNTINPLIQYSADIATGLTGGIYNPTEGTVGLPGLGTKKISEPIRKLFPSEVEVSPVPGEMVGTILPWSATSKAVTSTVRGLADIMKPAAVPAVKAGAEYVASTALKQIGQLATDVATRAGIQGITGGLVAAMKPSKSLDENLANIIPGMTAGAALSLAIEAIPLAHYATRSKFIGDLESNLTDLLYEKSATAPKGQMSIEEAAKHARTIVKNVENNLSVRQLRKASNDASRLTKEAKLETEAAETAKKMEAEEGKVYEGTIDGQFETLIKEAKKAENAEKAAERAVARKQRAEQRKADLEEIKNAIIEQAEGVEGAEGAKTVVNNVVTASTSLIVRMTEILSEPTQTEQIQAEQAQVETAESALPKETVESLESPAQPSEKLETVEGIGEAPKPTDIDILVSGGETDAESIRSTEGQLPEGRNVIEESKGESSEDIQQQKVGGSEGVQGETEPEAQKLLTKHEANIAVQRSLETEAPLKMVRVGRKFRLEPMTPEEVSAMKNKPVVKKTGVKAIKRPPKQVVESLEEELFATEEEAREAMESLMGIKQDYTVVGNKDIGYSIVNKSEIEIELPVANINKPKYEPMSDAEIQEGMSIDMTKGMFGTFDESSENVAKNIKARIDSWYKGEHGKDFLLSISDDLNTAMRQFPEDTNLYNSLVDRLTEANTEKASKLNDKTLSFMGTGELVKMIKEAPDDFRYIYELGKRAYTRTSMSFEEFVSKMKSFLKDVWDAVKPYVKKAWDTLRDNRGGIGEWPLKNVYSKLEKIVRDWKGERINPKDLLIKVRSEVKADELTMTKIERFLEDTISEGKRSIDKKDILRYIDENQLELSTIVFSSDKGNVKYPVAWNVGGPKTDIREIVFITPKIEGYGAHDTAHYGDLGKGIYPYSRHPYKHYDNMVKERDYIYNELRNIDRYVSEMNAFDSNIDDMEIKLAAIRDKLERNDYDIHDFISKAIEKYDIRSNISYETFANAERFGYDKEDAETAAYLYEDRRMLYDEIKIINKRIEDIIRKRLDDMANVKLGMPYEAATNRMNDLNDRLVSAGAIKYGDVDAVLDNINRIINNIHNSIDNSEKYVIDAHSTDERLIELDNEAREAYREYDSIEKMLERFGRLLNLKYKSSYASGMDAVQYLAKGESYIKATEEELDKAKRLYRRFIESSDKCGRIYSEISRIKGKAKDDYLKNSIGMTYKEADIYLDNLQRVRESVRRENMNRSGTNLGWIRINDRNMLLDKDNPSSKVPVLFLQEAQNKRGMEARSEGIFAIKGDEARLERMLEDLKGKEEEYEGKIRAIRIRLSRGLDVPWAPFLKDSPEFHMKWLISYAIEKGYDRIAWITGKQQSVVNSSLQLFNYTDEVKYRKDGRIWDVGIRDLRTGGYKEVPISDSSLESYVGEELAEAMRTGAGDSLENGWKSIKGKHELVPKMKEWAIDLYDNRLPRIFNKLIKANMKTGYIEVGEYRDGEKIYEPVHYIDLDDKAIENAKKGFQLYSFPFIDPSTLKSVFGNIIDFAKKVRDTQVFYRDRKATYNIVGQGPITINWVDKPDIPAILPIIEHSTLITSKNFAPYRKYVIDILEAYLRMKNDIGDISLLLDEIRAGIPEEKIPELTRIGYVIDKFGHKLRGRLTRENIKEGMNKKEAYEKAVADSRPIIDKYIETRISDEDIMKAYTRLRNEFFEPFREKMIDLIKTKIDMTLYARYPKEYADTVKAIYNKDITVKEAIDRLGLVGSKNLEAFHKVVSKYKRNMEKADDWGEKDYWSRTMPGNFIILRKGVDEKGNVKERIVGVAKTLGAAKEAALDYAIDAGLSYDEVDIKEKRYIKGRHISDVFVGATKPTMRVMKGLENIFDTAEYYSAGMNKKIYLDPVRWELTANLPDMPPNVARHLVGVYEAAKGEYGIIDEVVDSIARELTSGAWMPRKLATSTVEKSRNIAIAAKLAYRPVSEAINVIDGLSRVAIEHGIGYMIKAEKFLNTEEGKQWLLDHKWILGMKAFESEGHITTGTKAGGHMFLGYKNMLMPMGRWSQGELIIRPRNAVAAYLQFVDNKLEELSKTGETITDKELDRLASRAVIESLMLLQGINAIPSLPKWMRGTAGRAVSPFKPFLTRTIEWFCVRYNDPKFLFAFTLYAFTIGGPRAILKMIESIPFIAAVGAFFGLDNMYEKADEYLLRKSQGRYSLSSFIAGGLPGFMGKDIASQVAVQLPLSASELLAGVVISTAKNISDNIIVPVLRRDENLAAEVKKGIKTTIPAVRDVWEAIDSFIDKDGWVRDERGMKKYNLTNEWDRAMAAMGVKPIDRAYMESVSKLSRAVEREDNRKIDDILSYATVQFRKHHNSIPPEVMNKIKPKLEELYIKPDAILNRIAKSELPPPVKQVLESKIKNKEIVLREYREAGDIRGKSFLFQ